MKFKLLGKVLLLTLTPIVLGVAALTSISSMLTSGGLYDMADIQLLEFANKQASEIDNVVKNAVGVGDIVSSLVDIEGMAAMANDLGDARDYAPEFQNLRAINDKTLAEVVEDIPAVTAVALVDKNGKTIAASSATAGAIDISKYPSVVSALAGQDMVSTAFSNSTGKMSAMIGLVVDDDSKNPMGALLFVLDLPTIADTTIKDVKLMPTTNIFLVDTEGVMLMERAFPELIGKDNSIYEYIRTVLSQKNGITRYDWEGVPKVTHFAELPYTKWIIGIETDESDFYTTANEISMVLVLVGLAIVIVVALIVFVVIKKVVAIVSQGASIASYVAEGNLELTSTQIAQMDAALKRKDEFSDLAAALSGVVQSLAKMVAETEQKGQEAQIAAEKAAAASVEAEKSALEADDKRKSILEAVVQLEGIVNNIASASEQLSSQIELSTSGAEEQSARMTETATAMDEMNSTVLEVARNSGVSAEIADNTQEKATAGAKITLRCQESMTQVKDESMKLRHNMGELASHAQSISAVMSVISDIADQTNLLALNAAIEAARAGEAGRGFAVVADEVRKLAEKTITSTTDVANAINAIQQSTEVNVKQVDTAVERIEEATELAIEGGKALQIILEMAEQSADGIRAIATASEEQSATSDEIASSIATVSEIANNNVSAMNEATQAVASLSEQAQQLSVLVENLKNS